MEKEKLPKKVKTYGDYKKVMEAFGIERKGYDLEVPWKRQIFEKSRKWKVKGRGWVLDDMQTCDTKSFWIRP